MHAEGSLLENKKAKYATIAATRPPCYISHLPFGRRCAGIPRAIRCRKAAFR